MKKLRNPLLNILDDIECGIDKISMLDFLINHLFKERDLRVGEISLLLNLSTATIQKRLANYFNAVK